jgi:hypothetical protein
VVHVPTEHIDIDTVERELADKGSADGRIRTETLTPLPLLPVAW